MYMEPGHGLRLLYSGRSGPGASLAVVSNKASQQVGRQQKCQWSQYTDVWLLLSSLKALSTKQILD